MIAVASSVVVAVFRDEPEAHGLLSRLVLFDRRVISAANWLEASMVCLGGAEDPDVPELFDGVVKALQLEILPVTREQALLARRAFLAFGKGRKHPASLNFGDCLAYALAKSLDAPLLFKGDDFVHTDVKVA